MAAEVARILIHYVQYCLVLDIVYYWFRLPEILVLVGYVDTKPDPVISDL
jgi:hypothetical protein